MHFRPALPLTPHARARRASLAAGGHASLALLATALGWPRNAGAARDVPLRAARPVRLVLTVPPAGGMDNVARMLARHLAVALAQPVVVENHVGASGLIGNEHVARSAADGHTLLLMGSSLPMVEAAARVAGRKLAYASVREFTPISLVAHAPFVLAVRAHSPVRSVANYVATARARPGAISYASSGAGRTDHVAGALFAVRAGIELLHVPFRGMGPALQAVLGGQVDSAFGALPAILPHVAAGRMRILGVVQGQRVPLLPEVPTLAEAAPLPGYAVPSWIGIMAPGGTPAPAVGRLNRAIVQCVRDAAFARIATHTFGLAPVGSTPEHLGATVRAEHERYAQLFRDHPLLLR